MKTVNLSTFEIDWSLEPADDRERRIRQAVIRRVLDGPDRLSATWALQELADRDEVATDLRAAIEDARRRAKERVEKQRRDRNKELVRLAIGDVAAGEVALEKSLVALQSAFGLEA